MLRFLADENLSGHLVRGLRRQAPQLDLKTVLQVRLGSAKDPVVLEFAASEGRLLLTQDVRTITRHAYKRVEAGLRMPGVVEVPRRISLRQAVEDVLLIAACSHPDEWEGRIIYLPLR